MFGSSPTRRLRLHFSPSQRPLACVQVSGFQFASLSGILDKVCMVKGEQKGTYELRYLRLKRILVQLFSIRAFSIGRIR